MALARQRAAPRSQFVDGGATIGLFVLTLAAPAYALLVAGYL